MPIKQFVKKLFLAVSDGVVVGVVAAFLIVQCSPVKADETVKNKYLTYQYSDTVRITISNVPCMLIGIKEKYDWAIRADRIDGNKLIGCFKKQDENYIEIQWYKGDTTVLPANAFLQPKLEDAEKAKPKIDM